MDEQLIPVIEKEYRLRLKEFSPLKKAWIIDTERGPYFFKNFVFQDGSRLRFIDGAMRHLLYRGYDHIIPFEKTRSGNPFILHQRDVYFMTPFLDLRQSDYDQPNELSRAAEILAGLHLSSHGYQPPETWNPQNFWGCWPRRMKEKIQHMYTFRADLEAKPEWDEFDLLYAEYFPYYFQQAHQAFQLLNQSDYQRLMAREQRFHTICHHDYEYHNVLISPKNHYYVIDFDYLLCDTHLHDLASLLIRAGKRSFWNEQQRERVLNAYHAVYPIRPEEIPVLKAMMLFPQAFWQVGFARYFEQQPWPLERFSSEILRKVRQESERLRYITNLHDPE